MNIFFNTVKNDAISLADQNLKPEEWCKKIDWIDIRTEDRTEVVDYLKKRAYNETILDCIEHPEAHPFSTTSGNIIIINITISNASAIYKTDYISVIIEDALTITILPSKNDLVNEMNLSVFSEKKYPSLRNFLFNILVIKILAESKSNMRIARNRLKDFEEVLVNNPEDLSSKDLILCERDINQLADIIEDQYSGFEILALLSSTQHNKVSSQQTNSIIKGFAPLDKAMTRLVEKAASLRVQFMLLQQERAAVKINTLTILQGIFVPITFIAGVYGMNFTIMPELNWEFGYVFVWSIFILITVGLLTFFYKKGWFD